MRATLLMLLTAVAAGGCDRASPPAEQGGATPDEVAPSGPPPAPADKIDRSHRGEAAPGHGFTGADGPTSLTAFRGRPVLVNLWATWCGPCIRELPTLDALAAKGEVQVVALSQDADAGKAAAFFAGRKFGALKAYTDPEMQWLGPVTTNLPTTILYDAAGREQWRVLGDLDWTGKVATAALAEVRARGAPSGS